VLVCVGVWVQFRVTVELMLPVPRDGACSSGDST
jgi:hypothetical protein